MIEQSKIQKRPRGRKSRMVRIPPNVLARADRVIR